MRRFYSFITLLVMVAFSTFASIKVVVNTGNVCQVSYMDNSTQSYVTKTLAAGENTISNVTSMSFNTSNSDYIFTAFSKDGNELTGFNPTNYYISQVTDGATYNVTVSTIAAACDATCHVTIDTPSKVVMRTSGTNRSITLSSSFDLKFISKIESPITIGAATYGTRLYQIILNGEKQTVTSYDQVAIKDGDNLQILATFPNVNFNVTLKYADGAEGFITGVTVDNTAVKDFSNGFQAKAGATVTLTGNTSDYKYDEITINGKAISYFYGSTSFVIDSDTEVSVKAHKLGNFNVNVNCDDPSNILFYNGSDTKTLVAGDNVLSIPESNSSVTIRPNTGCVLTSVLADGVEKYSSSSGYAYFNATSGMNIVIKSQKIVRDKKFSFYVNNWDYAKWGYSVTRADRSTITTATGYNVIPFYSGDVPMMFSAYGADSIAMYRNGSLIDPSYPGATYYTISSIEDQDVIKLFLNEKPVKYYVSVKSTVADEISVTKDVVCPVNNYNSFSVLGPTQIDIVVEGNPSVLVNDEPLLPVDGKYTFVADKNTSVSITELSAVQNISVETAKTYDVYNLQGIRVARNVSNTDSLPAGIYIVNGKKVLVK